MFKKAVFLSVSLLSVNAYAGDKSDFDQILGNYQVDGFDTSAEEKYSAKLTIKKTFAKGKKIVFYVVRIDHSKSSGLGTYYGVLSDMRNNELTIEYQNSGKQSHKVTCNYSIAEETHFFSNCKGSLLGNIGGDGTFEMLKESTN